VKKGTDPFIDYRLGSASSIHPSPSAVISETMRIAVLLLPFALAGDQEKPAPRSSRAASGSRRTRAREPFTLRFTIFAGPGPKRLYTLLSIEEPETTDTQAKLKAFPTLGESVGAMKDIVRDLTPMDGASFLISTSAE
jgi:hypothetical protein